MKEVERCLVSIVENTCLGIKNALIEGVKVDNFERLNDYIKRKFISKDKFVQFFTACTNTLTSNKFKSTKLTNLLSDIEHINIDWS